MDHVDAGSPSRDAVVMQLFELFRRAGFEGVSLSDISAATGLGKSSLYYHFPGGKSDMAAAVLDFASNWIDKAVVAPLEASGSRRARIEAMLSALDALYCGGAKPCILASMLLDQSDPAIKTAVKTSIARWIKAIERALADTGARRAAARKAAVAAVASIEGALVVSRALDERTPFTDAVADVKAMLLGVK